MEEAVDPSARKIRRRALIAASAFGLALAGAAWALRVPIAGSVLRGWLGGSGVDSAFEIERLSLTSAELSAVTLGAAGRPDFEADRLDVRLVWSPMPRVAAVHLINPHLRVRMSEGGVSLGALDALLPARDGPARPVRLPALGLEIVDGRIDIDTPYGALLATADASGTVGRDFSARIRLPPTSSQRGMARLESASGLIEAFSDAEGVRARLALSIARAVGAQSALENIRAQARFDASPDFLRAELHSRVTAERAALASVGAGSIAGDLRLLCAGDASLRQWTGDALLQASGVADAASVPKWRAARAWARANIGADRRSKAMLQMALRVQATGVSLTPAGARALAAAWPELGALPIGPLVDTARDATVGALADASLDAPFRATLDEDEIRLSAHSPASVAAGSGAQIVIVPRAFELRQGAVSGAARVELSGGGYPSAAIEITRVGGGGAGALTADGVLTIADWQDTDARLQAAELPFRFAQTETGGRLLISGSARMSGPIGSGAHVSDLDAPLNLSLDWGSGIKVAPTGPLCLQARFAELRLPGLVFRNGAAPLCAEEAGYFSSSAEAGVSGGVTIAPIALHGHVEGAPHQTAVLDIARLTARFSGTGDRLVLDARVEAPRLRLALARGRATMARAEEITAQMVTGSGAWRADGRIVRGAVDDDALPAHIRGFGASWNAVPRGDEAVLQIEDGAAEVLDRAPVGAEGGRVPAFQPMRVRGMYAILRDGRLAAEGALLLEDGRPIGIFEATHQLEGGDGEATLHVRDLAFTPRLQPHDLSEAARALIANVSGRIDAEIRARWAPDAFGADARLNMENVSFSSATLPVVENVRGEVVFDDLLEMTTPPRQELIVGRINPGVEVLNGVIEFQLLGRDRLAIERAEWPFASGVLAIAPTEVTLGAEETRVILTLSDIDVAVLLAQLNIPDLVATGRVAGRFPLVLTAQSARIEDGALAADERGGEIFYAGAAAREATGVARLAFEALTRFRYDNLTLQLNGDLDGELVTAINFSGRNAGNLDIGAGGGGPLQPSVANVPFIFNVRVTAPFRRLGEMAAGAFDPTVAIDQAGRSASEQGEIAPAPAGIDRPRSGTE